MNNVRIEVFDSHDLIDFIGDLDLAIHFCCSTSVSKRYDPLIDRILTRIGKILSRYAPRTDELVHYINEFRVFILSDKTDVDINSMLFLYDCFSHDLINFIEYASTIGMSKENEHVMYRPTYMGIEQLLQHLTQTEIESDDIEFF